MYALTERAPHPGPRPHLRVLLLILILLALATLSFVTPAAGGQFAFTEFPLPDGVGQPWSITAGPDGNVWFTEAFTGETGLVGRITRDGVITEFPVPVYWGPADITTGPDGNLWFPDGSTYSGAMCRLTPTGDFALFPIPTAGGHPEGIVKGPDDNLWFTEGGVGKIGRITPQGVVTEFALPTPDGNPRGITRGSDGNLWFTETDGNKIGRITTAGEVTEFELPTANSAPWKIAAGADGNLWFTEPRFPVAGGSRHVARFARQETVTRRPCRAARVGLPSGRRYSPRACTRASVQDCRSSPASSPRSP